MVWEFDGTRASLNWETTSAGSHGDGNKGQKRGKIRAKISELVHKSMHWRAIFSLQSWEQRVLAFKLDNHTQIDRDFCLVDIFGQRAR